jgi:hypothetical protein
LVAVNLRGALVIVLVACGDPAAHVRLEPVPLPNGCGKPPTKTALRVIAFTPGGELRRTVPPTEIDAFPEDTEQLGVEVIGGPSGELAAIGKTAPLAFDALADGTTIPIVMAPPDGFCPVGAMTEPRVAPHVARLGDGAVILGGLGPGGERLASAEYFDPTTATFSPIQVPTGLIDPDNGFAGAELIELPDGRVLLTGTASHAFAELDPVDRTFTVPTLFEHRAFHGAIALSSEALLLIGGCADVVAGACSGPSLRTGFRYRLDDLSTRERGPTLPDMAKRLGARILDLGVQRDGVRRYSLAGGFGDPGIADRFAADDLDTETLAGFHAQHVALDGGAVLSAFEPDGSVQTGVAGVLAPDGPGLAAIASSPKLDGARLITLEDGSVLAFGGDPTGNLARYVPTTNTWSTIVPAGEGPGPLDAPVTVRLADGSVLVLGGRAPTASAWIYRPSLVGPSSGALTALPDDPTGGVLTAPDPSAASYASGLSLAATGDDLRARVLVGGPRMTNGSITAVVTVDAGGVALIAQQTGPGHMIVGRLVPGEDARIEAHEDGAVTTLCTGTRVEAAELTTTIGLSISEGNATLTVGAGGTTKASCGAARAVRGAWGIAAAGAGARIDLGPIRVERSR